MTGHAAWDELAAGHALDSLEPADEQELLRHLRGCAACERTLAEMRALAGQLAYAAEPAEPPAALGRSILDAVGASERPPLGRAEPRRPRARRPRGPWLLTATAVFGVLVLGLWNAALRMEAGRRDAVLALRERFERMELAADARATLVGADGARGLAVVDGRRVMLLVDGLAVTHPGPDVYVVWVVDRSGRAHPAGPFEIANADGPNVVPAADLPVPPADVAEVAVSREAGPAVPSVLAGALLRGELRPAG